MFIAAFISEQGLRTEMEDAHFLDLNFGGLGWVYGGIYDGHGGSYAARYTAEHLPELFLQKYRASKLPLKAFTASYEQISDNMKNIESGTTAADFFIKDDRIYVANVGDTRAIVISRSKVLQLTIDHRIGNPDEEQRISRMGGVIRPPYVMRGLSGLMPTRTIGDASFKPVGIIATPSVREYEIQEDDLYLIAGCDGLFDFMSNEGIAEVARKYTKPNILLENLKQEVLFNRGGTDNLTVIAVTLH